MQNIISIVCITYINKSLIYTTTQFKNKKIHRKSNKTCTEILYTENHKIVLMEENMSLSTQKDTCQLKFSKE